MGFITKKTSDIQVNAYYTQKGRSLFASGTDSDKIITYFSFGDNDINYNLDINTATANIQVPDLTGDVDDCLKSITEEEIINPVFYQKPSNDDSFVTVLDDNGFEISLLSTINYEVRLNVNNILSNSGKNFVKIEVDLFKYISYLKTFGAYSTVLNSQYNINDSKFNSTINILDEINVYDTVNSISSPELRNLLSFELSPSDYNTFKQYNRFLLSDTGFYLTEQLLNYQTPPLQYIFKQNKDIDLTVNNRTLGYGVWSITNSVYTLVSFTSISDVVTNGNILTVDNSNTNTVVRPTINVSYNKDGNQENEYFIIREDYLTRFNSNIVPENQYSKCFIDPNTNKTIIYREAELLESYILNRVDLFDNISNVYTSKPFTLRVKSSTSDLKIKDGIVKVLLKYDTTTIYTPTITDKFVTIS